jgi:hypothetical protein
MNSRHDFGASSHFALRNVSSQSLKSFASSSPLDGDAVADDADAVTAPRVRDDVLSARVLSARERRDADVGTARVVVVVVASANGSDLPRRSRAGAVARATAAGHARASAKDAIARAGLATRGRETSRTGRGGGAA